jgi:iron complex outermembrane recepter protein
MRFDLSSPRLKTAAAALLASTMLLNPAQAVAQEAPAPPAEPADPAEQASTVAASDEDEIVITATKRAENLQDVPLAVTAIGTKQLDDLQVNDFDDFAKLVPSLSYKSSGPGSSNVYFRGVASGENANHSASLPSVGTYLDEQPITTIQGALDVHIFDIARVEALAGPQGTLYGASSQAGTIRIITNKPEIGRTYGAINLELNKVAHGDIGYSGEGFINFGLSDNVAARLVGWYRRDGGYIDNNRGVLNFVEYTAGPTPTGNIISFDNDRYAEDNYNDVDTYGARAALKIDLNDSWTITPQVMAQRQISRGSFAEESGLGDLETMQFNKERVDDKWWQAALTVEGKIADFDITYAGAYMKRQVDGAFDYSDYAYFYNNIYGYGAYWYDNAGNPINPNQYVRSDDSFTKQSHEFRVTSPADRRFRVVAGLFYQRQTHNIEQNYIIDNLADALVVPGTESNIWLTKQLRIDRDYAAFGEVAFDITPKLTATLGGRLYKFDNSLEGFFGYSAGYSSRTGVAACFDPNAIDGAPCTNLDKRTKDDGFVHRVNLTYKPNDDLLLYATWSKGFRPGGINRRGTLPPYSPDFLTNYEAGVKFSFGEGSHFNAAVYREDWDDIQLSFLGENGLTEIRNAGNARIYGVEADLLLRAAEGLTWSTGVAYNNARIKNDFCKIATPDFDCTANVDLDNSGAIDNSSEFNELLAEKNTVLPLTAKLKINSRVRYEWDLTPEYRAHAQVSATFEGKRRRDLRDVENDIYGNLKSYVITDFVTGVERGPWNMQLYVKNLFDARGQISKGIQCVETVCGDPLGQTDIGGKVYTVVTRPRTMGLRVGYKF